MIGLFELLGFGGILAGPLVGRIINQIAPCVISTVLHHISGHSSWCGIATVVIACLGIEQIQSMAVITFIFSFIISAQCLAWLHYTGYLRKQSPV